jgi:hypothetical protein
MYYKPMQKSPIYQHRSLISNYEIEIARGECAPFSGEAFRPETAVQSLTNDLYMIRQKEMPNFKWHDPNDTEISHLKMARNQEHFFDRALQMAALCESPYVQASLYYEVMKYAHSYSKNVQYTAARLLMDMDDTDRSAQLDKDMFNDARAFYALKKRNTLLDGLQGEAAIIIYKPTPECAIEDIERAFNPADRAKDFRLCPN